MLGSRCLSAHLLHGCVLMLNTRQSYHAPRPVHRHCLCGWQWLLHPPGPIWKHSSQATQWIEVVAVLLQKDTDGTPLLVPDSPSSSSTQSEGTEAEEVAAYCQVRNIWTILGGNLNKPGAKQATKVHHSPSSYTCLQRGCVLARQGHSFRPRPTSKALLTLLSRRTHVLPCIYK